MDPMDYTTIQLGIPARHRPIVESAAALGDIVLREQGNGTLATGQHSDIARFRVFLDRLNDMQ